MRSLLGVTSLLLACGGAPPAGGSSEAGGPGSESGDQGVAVGEVHAKVDFTRPGAPTGDLIGWNLGRGTLYATEGDPLHPEWRTPARVAAAQALAGLRPGHGRAPLMRFSGLQNGGAGDDGYHFYEFVEPGRAPAAADDMASFQFFALFHEADAAPIVTLNFGSGTASEAAAYVTHLNGTDAGDPNVAARTHWGVEQPYRQTQFELGDGRPSASAAEFAARGLEYVAAVRAVEPQAKFWVPLSQASIDGWGGVEAATQALAPLLKDQGVSGAVIHHYLVDDARPLGWEDPNDPQFVLAGTELFRPQFERVRAALEAVRPGLPVVVTEYHVAGTLSRGQFTRGEQAIVGLGIAGMQIFYAQLGVAAACQQMALEFETIDDPQRDPLIEPWYNPFRAADDGVTPMASYTATKLVAEHLLERAAPLEFTKQVFKDMVVGSGTVAAPLVHAAAFVDPAGGGTVVALHRELQATRTWTIDVPDGWAATSAIQWAPPSVEHDTRAQPVATEPLEWAQDGGRVQVTLRPHSVVALRFAAQ